jgi:acetylornithine deacetylase
MIAPVELTKELIRFDSISRNSNVSVSDHLHDQLDRLGFTIERIPYQDEDGIEKVSLVGRKGEGNGGLALLGHSDTVPVDGWEEDPFEAVVRQDKLYGRGSCDMKGSLACMLAAAESFSSTHLLAPLYIVFTADEEVGCQGAKEVLARSELFNEFDLKYGIIGEPTLMQVVRAHKGAIAIRAKGVGRAAHSSTGSGINANLKIIPFLSEMKTIYDALTTDPQYFNDEFDPPFSDWNIGINDGGVALNMTAPQSVCTVYYRPMPGQNQEAILNRVQQAADNYDIELTINKSGDPFITPLESKIIQTSMDATGTRQAYTVPYGTDGLVFGKKLELVVMGPGDIKQAHTVNEWMSLEQFDRAIEIYKNMIHRFCVDGSLAL